MGQRRAVGEVADGEHPIGGPPLRIDHDEAALVDGCTGGGDLDGVTVGASARDDGDPVGREHQIAIGPRDGDAVIGYSDRPMGEAQAHAEVAQPPLDRSPDALAETRQDAVLELDDRDPAPELGEGAGQLHADVAAAYEDEVIGEFSREEQFG